MLFGGAAGGAKSSALLMAGLMFVEEPDYAAMLFRRTFADLSLPGALMDRAAEWLSGTPARWNDRDKTWRFPSGATLTFGYLDGPKDKYRYQGMEAQFIGVDELTQIRPDDYLYLHSRLRKTAGQRVPLRVRNASNPGGESHNFVYERFVVGEHPGRVFVPSLLDDNPHLDTEEYERSLAELDDVTRAQLLQGLWITDPKGKPFKRDWWRGRNRYDATDPRLSNAAESRWMSWDTAVKDKEGNAYTACVVGELQRDYTLLVREVWRGRIQFPELPDVIADMAARYNRDYKLSGVVIEDAATGAPAYQTLMASSKEWLKPLLVPYGVRASKEERWAQAAVWAKRGTVKLPHPSKAVSWLHDFEEELFEVPHALYADQVDAFSQLVIYLEHYLAAAFHGAA